jgi:hypothetical protein
VTITNYTGEDIVVELRLNKTFGSTRQTAVIRANRYHEFNTGIYGIHRNGIHWWVKGDPADVYYLDLFPVTALTTGLYIKLFKSDTYEYVHKGGIQNWISYMQNGVYPSGWGRIRQL